MIGKLVKCELCGFYYLGITWKHLGCIHGTTLEEYHKLFLDFPTLDKDRLEEGGKVRSSINWAKSDEERLELGRKDSDSLIGRRYIGKIRMERYGELEPLTEGVEGRLFTYEDRKVAVLSVVAVYKELRGKGYLKRFLDSLEEDYEVVVVPNVWSERLGSILKKRGYRHYGVRSGSPENPPADFWLKSKGLFDLGDFLLSIPSTEKFPIWVEEL